MLVAASGPVDCEPEVGLVPDQAPEAWHPLAFVATQRSIDAPPLATDAGSALMTSVGAGTGPGAGDEDTRTVTDWLVVPPSPVQVNVYVRVAASAPVDWDPEVGLPPDQAPDAWQVVASDEDQVNIDAAPLTIVEGLALSVTVGSSAVFGQAVNAKAASTANAVARSHRKGSI